MRTDTIKERAAAGHAAHDAPADAGGTGNIGGHRRTACRSKGRRVQIGQAVRFSSCAVAYLISSGVLKTVAPRDKEISEPQA